jgi:hypothetical protein
VRSSSLLDEPRSASSTRSKHAKFYCDFNQAGANVIAQVEQNIVRMSETDPRPAIWFLSKRAPETYGNSTPDEREALQKQVVIEFLDFIRNHVQAGTYQEILRALSDYGDTELDAKALPCPGWCSHNGNLRTHCAATPQTQEVRRSSGKRERSRTETRHPSCTPSGCIGRSSCGT